MNLLLSYPRSGNTWYRYCIEYLTKKPTVGYAGFEKTVVWDYEPLGFSIDIGVNLNADNILIKRHGIECLYEEVESVILLIRNYKECIVRHCCSSKNNKNFNISMLKNACHKGNGVKQDYVGLIEYYDQFPKEKMVVYYEDLVDCLKPTLKKSLQFLNEDDQYLESFMSDIQHQHKECMSLYGNSQTKGKNSIFHSTRMSAEQKTMWDNYLIEYNNELYDKYLKRYKE